VWAGSHCQLGFGLQAFLWATGEHGGKQQSCGKKRLRGTSDASLSSWCCRSMHVTRLSFGEVMCISPACLLRTAYFLVKGCRCWQLQKIFPALFGTEPTSSFCLVRVQGTKTCAAPCCREAPSGRRWLAVGWSEGQWQALFGWAGCSLATTSPSLMAFSPCFQVALQSVFRRRVCLEQRAVHKDQRVPKQLLGLGW